MRISNTFNDFYKGKRVLVTGHTGFKGAWLAQVLLNFGADVVGVSLKPNTKPNLFDVLSIENKIKNYFTDIRDCPALRKIFEDEKPEIVFHLAAQALVRASYDDPIGTIATNVLGTANVLEAIKESGCVKSAVIITTDKVYENKEQGRPFVEADPLGGYDPYSASKSAADIVANCYIKSFFNPDYFGAKHNTLVAITRAGNVIGGGDWADNRIIPDIVRVAYAGAGMEVRSPSAIRPWQHVLEPLLGYMMLGKGLYEGDTTLSGAWNFGPQSESFVTVKGLLDEVVKNKVVFDCEIKPDNSKHEAGILKLDITKAQNVLHWTPKLNFSETIKSTFDWYKNYYEKLEDVVEFTNKQINTFLK